MLYTMSINFCFEMFFIPSLDVFERQGEEYISSVIDNSLPTIVIEASHPVTMPLQEQTAP